MTRQLPFIDFQRHLTVNMLTAGACAVHDLPSHLLYTITRGLDLRSQRNLFLCSSHLYRRWQLQVPEHKGWQLVERSIKLLEAATIDKLCDKTSYILLTVHTTRPRSSGITYSAIRCKCKEQKPLFSLNSLPQFSSAPMSDRDTAGKEWSGMTKDQLWHRLAGAPDLVLAKMTCRSHPKHLPASDQLKLFARQTFDLLCSSQGLLTIFMNGLEDSPEETEDGCHFLSVWHSTDCQGSSVWEIDGESCIVDPPNVRFDVMPEKVTAIKAYVCSQPEPDIKPLSFFYPDSQVIHDFAYQGNVDVDAWVEMQHEAANDWYDHMDDFDEMEDLDDIDMANLLGAMQG